MKNPPVMKNPLMQFVAVFTFAVFGLPYGHAVAAEPPGAKEPLPATRTFFIEGVRGQSDVTAITGAVLKVEHVTKVEELTASSGFANILFDHHAVTHQQIAQAIADAGKFKVSCRFAIPGYRANAEKVDALFTKLKDEVTIECKSREKEEFTLYFLPLKSGEAGFSIGKLMHPVRDPQPKGLGLKMTFAVAGTLLNPKAPAAK